jgi:hypothetical protein
VAATPPPATEEVSRPAIPNAPEPKDWEQKYRVLQGKYNHEVPGLQKENRDLKADVQALREEVDRLKQRPAEPPAPTRAPTVRPEEVEQYGQDFVDFVGRVAQSVAAPAAQKVDNSQLEQRVARSEEIASAALRRQFFNDLTDKVPDWEQLNTDAGFLKWLDSVDPLTGTPRQVLFDDAYDKLDLHRVSAFFTSFSGNVGAAPRGAAPPQSMVTPTTMRGASDVPQGKKIWTQREIGSFYNDMRTGRINPEDAARTEHEIFAAQNEGRVR